MPLSGWRRMDALATRPPRPRRWRIRVAVLVSLLIHLGIGFLLLVTINREEKTEQLPPPSAVTMMFDTGRKQGPTTPSPSLQATPSTPSVPPSPPAPLAPPAPAAPPPLPLPPLPTPLPPPPQEAPPAIEPPAPPAAAPPQPVAPQPAAPPVPSPPPPPPTTEQQAQPKPPVPAERQPLPPVPKPPPVQPQARRPAPPKPSDFPAPMNYSFGTPPRQSSSRQSAARPHIPGTIDMSLGPAARGAADNTPMSERDKDIAGADWRNALSNWVAAHAYYPREAQRDGEEGDAKVRVVATPGGRVKEVELIGRSGSMWLDLALQALFRDQQLPPLPPGTKEPIEFNFTMHYMLIRPH